MKHNILKIFSLLAAVMISSCVKIWGVSFRVDGIEYSTLSDNTVEVSGIDRNIENAIIPETVRYDGCEYTVTAVGNNASSGNLSLHTISLPSSILSIENFAFFDCQSLTDIGTLQNVESIGESAFEDSALTYVNIESDVESIGDSAFKNCKSLSEVYIKNVKQLGPYAFSGCKSLELVEGSIVSIDYYAFSGCILLSKLKLSDGVETIGFRAFENCLSLLEVDFLNKVKSIESSTFYNCISLQNINWPDNLETIGDYAFYNCVSLLEINLPNSVKDVGLGAFQGCGPLSIVLSENIETIGMFAFEGSQISEITFPESISDIGVYAFSNCYELRTINMKSPNPPSSGSGGFDYYIGEIVVLNVPVGAAELYKRYWSNFKTINEVNF